MADAATFAHTPPSQPNAYGPVRPGAPVPPVAPSAPPPPVAGQLLRALPFVGKLMPEPKTGKQ